MIAPLARELSSTPDLSRVELLGGLKRSVRVIVDPAKLKARGVSLGFVAKALESNDSYMPVGKNWSSKEVYDIDVGGRFESAEDIKNVAIGQRGGVVVKIKDVAELLSVSETTIRRWLSRST